MTETNASKPAGNDTFDDDFELKTEDKENEKDEGIDFENLIKNQLVPETEDGIKVEDTFDGQPKLKSEELSHSNEEITNNENTKNDENNDFAAGDGNDDFSIDSETSKHSGDTKAQNEKGEEENDSNNRKDDSQDFEYQNETPVRRENDDFEESKHNSDREDSKDFEDSTHNSVKEDLKVSDDGHVDKNSQPPSPKPANQEPVNYYSNEFEADNSSREKLHNTERSNEKSTGRSTGRSTSRSKKKVGTDEYEYEYVEEDEEEEEQKDAEQEENQQEKADEGAQANEEEEIPEEEVEAALDLILDGADPSQDFEPEILKKVIVKLTALRDQADSDDKYVQAEAYSQLVKKCQKSVDLAEFTSQCLVQLDQYRSKQYDAQAVIDEMNNYWDNEFRDFEEVIEEKKNELIQMHTKELDDFDMNYPTELPAKYQKHSPEYISLRRKQKALARNKEFTDAEVIKRQADRLEALENRKQLKKLQEDLQFQRDLIIDKHNRQLDRFAQWVTERRNMMLNAREKEMRGSRRRLEHYTMIVNNIEKHGLPPNPTNGFTTNRVTRKESIRACRNAAAIPFSRTTTAPSRKDSLPFQYRPQSSVNKRRSAIITPINKRRSSLRK